jgi:hypothetical protein
LAFERIYWDNTVELHLSGHWLSGSAWPFGLKVIENSIKLSYLEITGYQIKYSTMLKLLERNVYYKYIYIMHSILSSKSYCNTTPNLNSVPSNSFFFSLPRWRLAMRKFPFLVAQFGKRKI